MIVITGGPLVIDSMAKEAGNDIYYLKRNHERLGKEGGITMNVIDSITKEYKKNDIPEFNVGDTVRVHVKIVEGQRERIQVFEGYVLKMQSGGISETFTVRRVAYGVGVEKTFLLHSPLVEKVEVVRVGKARRAKLYYLRDRVGKAAKTKEDIGANLKRNDIVVKEEVPVEAPVAEEVKAEETPKAE